jgi:hypothetical protein
MVNIWQIQCEIIFNPVFYVVCTRTKGFTDFPKLQEFSHSARVKWDKFQVQHPYVLGDTLHDVVARDLCSPGLYIAISFAVMRAVS